MQFKMMQRNLIQHSGILYNAIQHNSKQCTELPYVMLMASYVRLLGENESGQ